MNNNENVINEKSNVEAHGNILELFSKIFSLKNIVCFLLVYLVSKLEFVQGVTPFNYAVVGAMQVFNVPLFLTLTAGILGTVAAGFSSSVLIEYIITIVLFTIISSFIKVEGINKKMATGLKLSVSMVIVQGVLMFARDSFLIGVYDLSLNLITTLIFYMLFVAATYVIVNLKNTIIFSKEEIISALLVIVIALAGAGNISIYGLDIRNVIGLFLVLLVGYKNGWILGAATGTVVGLAIGIIQNSNPILIAAYALSGLLSGLIRKAGKIGIFITFVLGSILFKKIYGENNILAMQLAEILVASTGLVLLPKKLELRVESLFNKNMMLESSYGKLLADSEDVKMKLEAIGDVFDNLASNIDSVKIDNMTKNESKEVVKSYIKNYKEKECLGCPNYKNCLEGKKLDITVDYIIDSLEDCKTLKPQALNLPCDKSPKILSEMKEVYKNIKIAYALKQRELENSKKVSEQYREVAKVITNISNNIIVGKRKSDDLELEKKLNEELKMYGYNIFDSEYKVSKSGYVEYTFITDILTNLKIQKLEIISVVSDILGKEMKIKMILNSSKTEKARIKLVSNANYDIKVATKVISKEEKSGDNFKILDLEDSKKVVMISDGESTGEKANIASLATLKMLEKLLKSGFSEDKAIKIVDNLLKMRGENERFASIDLAVLDELNEKVEFVKFGAAPSFVISKKDIFKIKSSTLPAGCIENFKYVPDVSKIHKNDIIIMLSDGVFSEELEEDKQNKFTDMLKNIDVNKTEEDILEDIDKFVKEEFKYTDDATIIVIKIAKNNPM